MKKISYTAIFSLIIQTIITFGINWIYFFIYYRLNKYSFLASNSEHDENSFIAFFKTNRDKLSIFSIVLYFIFLIIFSLSIMLVNDVNFFMILHYQLWDYIKSNLLYAILLAIIIFFLLTYGYKILMKNVYHTIYKNNNQYFDNYNETDLTIFILLCFLTLGWFYIIFLFALGIYELHTFMVNKIYNKTPYRFSILGFLALFSIAFLSLFLIVYTIKYHQFLSNVTIYFITVFILNIFLNYGFYELRMNIFLNKRLDILSKKSNFKLSIDKKMFSLCILVVVIGLLYSLLHVYNINDIHIKDFDNLSTDHLACEEITDKDYRVCRKSLDDFDESSKIYQKYNIWQRQYANYALHQKLIVSHVKADEIIKNPIVINYSGEILYTSKEGLLTPNSKEAYLYVQTYYKKNGNDFVPVFNIIKNLELILDLNNNSLYLSILNNNVYKYDFLEDTLNQYNEHYQIIDTSRLILDDLTISFKSNTNNIYGYNIKEELTYLDIRSKNNIGNLLLLISYLDPFPIDELLFHFSQTFSPLTEEKIKYLSPYDLSVFRLYHNTKHISYYNDRQYLYMANLNEREHIVNENYLFNEKKEIELCTKTNCDTDLKFYNNKIDIGYLSNTLYTDEYIERDDNFKINDNKYITLLTEGRKYFDGNAYLGFTIKTIKDYFTGQFISNESIIID